MAYDSLKALIRQYIKTNGEQEITGQILQNVLVEMVNQYPSTDGFATQSWVTSQGYITASALSGYATQSWVNTQLGGYLPLTGGNLDGNLSIYDTMNIYSSSIEWNDSGDYCRIAFDQDGITVTAHGTGYVTANEFIKSGGTSSQFLKADGSVDSNTYLTSAALSGYATQSWVTTQLGGYLPLTGGNLNGNLSIYDTMNIYSSSIEWNDSGDYCRIAFDQDGITVTAHGTGYVTANEFIKSGGTSSQFLKADGSVDSNTYLTSAALSGYATQSWVTTQLGGYLPLTGGNLDGNLSIYDTMNIYSSSIEWNDSGDYCRIAFDQDGITVTAHGTGYVTANEFIKSGGTSAQFLKADGSVSTLKTINGNSLEGSGDIVISGGGGNYLPLTGGTLTGGLIINTSKGVGENMLELYNTASYSGYSRAIWSSAPNMSAGAVQTFVFGKDSNIYNMGKFEFCYIGNQSSSNYVSLGLMNKDNLLNVLGTGNIGIGTVSPAYKLHVAGQVGATGFIKEGSSDEYVLLGGGGHKLLSEIGGGATLYDAEVEYLESDGNQWIDSGVYPTGDTHIVLIGSAWGGAAQEAFFWARDSGGGSGAFGVLAVGDGINIRTDYGSQDGMICTNSFIANKNFKIDKDKNATIIYNLDDNTSSTLTLNYASFTGSETIGVFGRYVNGTVKSIAAFRLHECKIYNNNTLIRDFIPVRVGNVGYLYDKVSGELFGNAGTGDFVLGQDTGPGGGLPYLPLTGGTITGNLTVDGAVKFNTSLTFAYDRGIYFGTDNSVRIMRDTSRLQIVNELGADIIIGDYDNRNYTSIVNDIQGGITNASYTSTEQTWYILNDGTAHFKSVSQTSDLRKKTIMGDVPINLYNVANAPLFKFTWKDEKKYSGQHIGSAAQYWQTVLPELVSIGRDADMTLAMQYDVIALASAITVAKTVVNHEERIILLERENEALKKEIADLKSA